MRTRDFHPTKLLQKLGFVIGHRDYFVGERSWRIRDFFVGGRFHCARPALSSDDTMINVYVHIDIMMLTLDLWHCWLWWGSSP